MLRSRIPAVFTLLALSQLSCTNDATTTSTPLRERFPTVATHIFDEGLDFEPTDEGFAVGEVPYRPNLSVSSRLPRTSSDPVVFRMSDGFSVHVRERGLEGEAALVDGVVAYARDEGMSYWASAPGGYEEWLHVNAGIATDKQPVATWDIAGGQVVQAGDDVQILDENGDMRLLVQAPVAHTISGKRIVPRLVADDSTLAIWVDAEGEEVLIDPSWTMGPNLSVARQTHTATLLLNGNVLIAGGGNTSGGATVATCNLYDPVANTMGVAASMATPRQYFQAIRLQNGKVLAPGGMGNGVSLATAELYDPATNVWTSAGSLSLGRQFFVAGLLADGRVIVAGGSTSINFDPVPNVDIYDPATNMWTVAPSMSTARTDPAGMVLTNGKFLVAGGRSAAGFLATAEIYDPATNSWTAAAPMSGLRGSGAPVRLNDGRVIIAGGYNGTNLTTSELYNPMTNSWSVATIAGGPGGPGIRATLLADGTVLTTGGLLSGTSAASIYQPATNLWTATNSMLVSRAYHTLTTLPNSKVLAAGGYNGAAIINTTEIYTPALAANGATCTMAAECLSGFCSDGVCCNTACAGACDACSVAAGAPTNGTCVPVTGSLCDDGNACTQMDSCVAGACVGANPKVCAALDQCHDAGTCNAATGACSNPNKMDGSACSDGNACTQTDACMAGTCVGANPKVCLPLDQCHDFGTCDAATGMCSNPALADGSTCNDGNACTQTDACMAGACVGANPKPCLPVDQCHDFGTCDSATGACSSPVLADGTACSDGNACTQMDTCNAGACVGANPKVCLPTDQCHDFGTCDAATGMCSNPALADGSTCNDGDACTQTDTCNAGVCQGANAVTCAGDECHDAGTCNATSGVCDNPAKADGTPCKGGLCKAGTCEQTGTGGAGGMAGGGGMGGEAGTGGTGGMGGKSETGGAGGSGGNEPNTDAGCGCRTVDTSGDSNASWFLLSLALVGLRRRLRTRS